MQALDDKEKITGIDNQSQRRGMYNGFLFAKVRKYMMPVYKELRIDYCNFTCGKTKLEICDTTIFENFGLYSECNLFQP